MLIVQNHHVIVPRTEDTTGFLDHIVTDPSTTRQAHVQHATLTNASNLQLDFTALSDLWVEVYVDNYRLLNPRYATHKTHYIGYEVFNIKNNNRIEFTTPVTGNVRIICDTLTDTTGETLHQPNVSGMTFMMENVQSYDLYEKRFNPSRYPMPSLGLSNTIVRIRVADALYSEPIVLSQPCYGYVRVSRNRKSLVYVPRLGFQGWDAFGYTLMSQHGQIGKPATCTVRVGGDDLKYNWSANCDGLGSFVSVRDHKDPYTTALAGKRVIIEFYYYTRSVSSSHNYRVGIFGQYNPAPKNGRYAVYLDATGATSSQVVVLQYCIQGFTLNGDPVYLNYKVSSKSRLEQQRWHHVVIQIDATNPSKATVEMFLNGFRETFYNNDFTAQNVHTGDHHLIAAVNDQGTSQTFDGYLSNFRFTYNDLAYSGERIAIPRRTLPITANTKILGMVNGIEDPESIQDMQDITRLQKLGNIDMVEVGPFSPVVLSSDRYQVMNGDTITVNTRSDYICTYSTVPWTINANVKLEALNHRYLTGPEPIFTIKAVDGVGITANTYIGTQGNFIIDDIDLVTLTVDTVTNPMQTRHRVDFYLTNWPLMVETYDVYADPGGLVMHIEATNDGFARDKINFSHGTLTSLGAYNNSLGGYFDFNGTTDVISGPSTIANEITNDISCEVWFRIRSGSVNTVRLFGKGTDADLSYGIFYTTANNRITWTRVNTESNITVRYDHSTSLISNWYQITAITQGELQKIYLNGAKVVEESALITPCLTNSNSYTIGSDTITGYHDGQVSVVRLYNRALSDAEVLANFNQYRTRYGL